MRLKLASDLVLALVLICAIPLLLEAQQDPNSPSTPSNSTDQPREPITVEPNSQSERERNLGTRELPTSPDPNRGELTGTPAPGSLPERVVPDNGPRFAFWFGGLLIGGILGFVIGRTGFRESANRNSQNRAA